MLSRRRADELGRDPAHRERYDWALARAVAEMPTLAEYLLPLVRVGGVMLAQRGEGVAAEVRRAELAEPGIWSAQQEVAIYDRG